VFLREVSGLKESDTHARLVRFWEAVHSGKTVQYQTDLPTPKGMQRRSTLLIPILNAKGQVSHLFYRGADVTDLLRKEQELQAVNAGLERKVEERTVALVAANRELEAFAYSVSHDLRTPLRGIDGYSKLLGDEFEAQLGPTGGAYLTRIRKGIQRMGTLIDDLLQLSRVTRAAVSRSLIDVSAMATEVAQEIA
jgi:signal transduction histidine kinase